MTDTAIDPAILASFEELKKNARKESDIASWFQARPFLLDSELTSTDVPVFVSLYNMDHMAVFKESDPNQGEWLMLSMARQKPPGPVTPFLLALNGTSSTHSSGVEQWGINIKLTEWSFIVAKIASRYVREHQWQNYTEQQRAVAYEFLKEQLPLHFSGLKPDALRFMIKSGLIDDVSLAKTQESLFNLRVTNVGSLDVPDGVSFF